MFLLRRESGKLFANDLSAAALRQLSRRCLMGGRDAMRLISVQEELLPLQRPQHGCNRLVDHLPDGESRPPARTQSPPTVQLYIPGGQRHGARSTDDKISLRSASITTSMTAKISAAITTSPTITAASAFQSVSSSWCERSGFWQFQQQPIPAVEPQPHVDAHQLRS